MKVLYRLSDRLFSRDVLLRIQAALDAAARYERMPVIQQINIEFSALDAKAAALISHLSVMVAAISFLHGAAEAYWLKAIFTVEIVFYIFTLCVVLRVIYYAYYEEISRAGGDQETKNLMEELLKRMVYYRIAHFLTNIGTFLLVPSVLATLFWH